MTCKIHPDFKAVAAFSKTHPPHAEISQQETALAKISAVTLTADIRSFLYLALRATSPAKPFAEPEGRQALATASG